MKYAIEVENLVKRYKKAQKNAVDDISFMVEEGEFFSFLGPNGAGKTTTKTPYYRALVWYNNILWNACHRVRYADSTKNTIRFFGKQEKLTK